LSAGNFLGRILETGETAYSKVKENTIDLTFLANG
jgi:hypothetical protein